MTRLGSHPPSHEIKPTKWLVNRVGGSIRLPAISETVNNRRLNQQSPKEGDVRCLETNAPWGELIVVVFNEKFQKKILDSRRIRGPQLSPMSH